MLPIRTSSGTTYINPQHVISVSWSSYSKGVVTIRFADGSSMNVPAEDPQARAETLVEALAEVSFYAHGA